MKLRKFYKKIAASLLILSILSLDAFFAFPQAISAQAISTNAAQSTTEAQVAGCIAQQAGSALSSTFNSLFFPTPDTNSILPGLGSNYYSSTEANNLLNNGNSTNLSSPGDSSGLLPINIPTNIIGSAPAIWGSSPGAIAYPSNGSPPINVSLVTATNFTNFMTVEQGNTTQLVNNSNVTTANSNFQKATVQCTDPILTSLARLAALMLIQNLTEATVNWINSGFSPSGAPGYVADPEQFLQNTADQVVGNVLFNDPSLNFLCAPFQAQVKLALGLSYSQPFYQQINCTLSGALANIATAANTSFNGAGGWAGWLQLTTQPQNNAVGAFLIAQENINSQISAKQASVKAQLNQGQGALTYESCTKNTIDANGNVIPGTTSTYTGSPSYILPATSSLPNNEQVVYSNCSVKTPGAIVTSQLAVQSNSDTGVLEIQAALGDGVDQVFSALLGALGTYLTSKINNGVLDTSADQSYDASLNGLPGAIQTNYNNGSISNPLNNYDDEYGTGYTEGFDTNPPVATESTSTDGISIDDPFYSQKTNSISIIDDILSFEDQYQNTDATALNILLAGRGVFANAQSCNIALGDAGDSVSYNRAIQINANVVSNIDQMTNYARTVAQVPWSLPVLENSINLLNTHLTLLNNATSIITNATSSQGITVEMNTVNGTNFNADEPIANLIPDMTAWFNEMGITYTTASCPIDLSSALSGAPLSSTTLSTSTPITATSTTN